EMHPADFSLLVPKTEDELTPMPEEEDVLIQKAAGLAGGVRFGEE
ncbi:TPA: phage tail assembly protein T, partial [Escherichia coli]